MTGVAARTAQRRVHPYRSVPVIATLIILAAVAGVLYYVLRGPGARA